MKEYSKSLKNTGAGDGNRTRIASLEGWSSTIELHPQQVVPLEGIEPPTLALRKPCSTPELQRP